VGVDSAYLARGRSYFTAETHLSFLNQTHAEDLVEVSTQILAADAKRLHLFHQLVRPSDGAVLAESESMLVHVDTRRGRAVPAEPEVIARITRIAEAHAKLPRPERAGRRVGDRRA
jgi:carnitine 3-dehydrogenase